MADKVGVVIDAFAGPGGWAEGLRMLGYSEVGIEWDETACATAEKAGHRRWQRDVAAMTLPPPPHDPDWWFLIGRDGELRPVRGFIGSPPCPGFSSSGNGAGGRDMPHIIACTHEIAAGNDTRAEHLKAVEDARSLLVVEPLRWALALRPEWIALEQVPEVLGYWTLIAQILSEHGYSTWVGILNAADYGVPQTRRRAILMASRTRDVHPPAPTHSDQRRAMCMLGLKPWITMAEALGRGSTARPSPTVTAGGTETGGAEVFARGGREGLERDRDAGAWLRVDRRQTGAPVVNGSEEPAPTVTTAPFGKGVWDVAWVHERPATTVCGDPRIGRPGHKDRDRGEGQFDEESVRVTVQEAAILQSFRHDYPWQGNKGKKHQQIGNAVPPFLARAVLAELVDTEEARRAA